MSVCFFSELRVKSLRSALLDFSVVFPGQTHVSSEPSVRHLWPQTSITSSYPPTFLTHGLADTIVPPSESQVIADVLKEKGVVHELVLVPGQEHGFDILSSGADVDEACNKAWAFIVSCK